MHSGRKLEKDFDQYIADMSTEQATPTLSKVAEALLAKEAEGAPRYANWKPARGDRQPRRLNDMPICQGKAIATHIAQSARV